MLLLEAEIYLHKPSDSASALKNDLETRHIIRPSINFGNDQLFSGDIWALHQEKMFYRGVNYTVLIKMPTIESEAFESIGRFVRPGNSFRIQTGLRVIGTGTIKDYIYEE
ncbi:hypothetical protein CDO73_02640 [Saccharibacillus sp. O23]|uniref:hypothetical protein n=1 Tax=Saccharibacillus sp. O23 TaxID=2009338 RepID=UPI000B4DF0EB|nr:hypothetical protein [Saccharibacillus sp. O23]OWR32520.1 hypothetical protein CDO73_02640 [Saccharibacillus sp. O23]